MNKVKKVENKAAKKVEKKGKAKGAFLAAVDEQSSSEDSESEIDPEISSNDEN